MYAGAIAFVPHDVATTGITTSYFLVSPIGLTAPGGLALDTASNF